MLQQCSKVLFRYIPHGVPTLLAFVCGVLFIACPPSSAQEERSKAVDEQRVMEQWKQTYDKVIESIRITAGSPDSELDLVRSKVLAVNNPDHDARHGNVYLFTHQGKPIVLSSIMSKTAADDVEQRTVSYEFHSLSDAPIEARKGGRLIWKCTEPGVTWSEEADAENASTNPVRRLTQMRAMAGRYSVKLIDANQPEDCRLLPQPLYRYPSQTPNVDDGALFSYVTSNNPKAYLLVEARKGKWHTAFARSGRWRIEVSRTGKELQVFEAGTFQKPGPFYQLYIAERRMANEPTTVISQKFPE